MSVRPNHPAIMTTYSHLQTFDAFKKGRLFIFLASFWDT